MTECRDDRGMVILPARDADPGDIARGAVAALGGDKQRGSEGFAAIESDGDSMFGAIDGHRLRLPVKHDIGRGFGARAERLPQVAVLVHPPEWLVIALGRFERQRTGAEPIGNTDGADRATGRGEMRGESDGIEHAAR